MNCLAIGLCSSVFCGVLLIKFFLKTIAFVTILVLIEYYSDKNQKISFNYQKFSESVLFIEVSILPILSALFDAGNLFGVKILFSLIESILFRVITGRKIAFMFLPLLNTHLICRATPYLLILLLPLLIIPIFKESVIVKYLPISPILYCFDFVTLKVVFLWFIILLALNFAICYYKSNSEQKDQR